MPADWCAPVLDLRAATSQRARRPSSGPARSPTASCPLRGFETAYGGQDDIGGSLTFFEMLGHVDLYLMVKAGVQWGLFGGAFQALGTERHHRGTCRR